MSMKHSGEHIYRDVQSTPNTVAGNAFMPDVSETAARFMKDEAALRDRATFVHNLGVLLSQTREQVLSCQLVNEEVVIEFKGGATKNVNVQHDSYLAIIRDVIKAI